MEEASAAGIARTLAGRIEKFKPSSYGLPVERYENIFVPAFGLFDRSFEQKLKDLEEKWEARAEDVWVVSYPKCGHAWSYDFLSMILKHSTELETRSKVFSFIEMSSKVFERLHETEGARLIMTHIPPHLLPQNIKKTSKIICIFRCPYDVALSYYYHTKNLNVLSIMLPAVLELLDENYKADTQLDPFVRAYCKGEIAYGKYDEYINSSMEMIRDYDGHYLTYENLQRNCLGELQNLSKFLHLQRTDEFLRLVAQKTSFDSIKDFARERYNNDIREIFNNKSKETSGALLIRKGKVGEGKKELSEEHIRMIQANIVDNIKNENLRKYYE